MAGKVLKRGKPMTLEPMPPNERRIIHLTLRDDDRVYTESVGEGRQRKVQIFPAD
jgi:spoIIIJ-associated protein